MRIPFPTKILFLLLPIIATCITPVEGKRKKHTEPQAAGLPVPQLISEKEIKCPAVQRSGKMVRLYDTISITFIGDVMQHGKQLNSALKEGENPNLPESYDYSYVFKNIEGKLKRSDLAIANMEFPLGIPPYSGYPLFSAPESIASQAAESGIGLALLANNHLLDKGKSGLLKTLDTYDAIGLRYIGAYRNREQEESQNPAMFNIKGIKVAFINFTYGTNGFPIPAPCIMNLMDSTAVKENISKAKRMGADIIICAPHWGEEYMLKPSYNQEKWAAMLRREGVKVIIGSHPHVPQGASISPEHIVFYSLGNYISNQTTPDYTQLELMVTVKIAKNNHTGETFLLQPEYEFLWCFKKGEFAPCYTVVPVEQILGKEELVKDKVQYRRMEQTYRKFIGMELIEEKF